MARFLASQIAQDAQGIGVKGVTQKYVSEMKIPLPPLEEQEKIIGQIEQYQKIITEANKTINIYKEKMDQTISDVWGE